MIIKKDLNQKELLLELTAVGIDSKTAQKEISKTIKNEYSWFRIGAVVSTYNERKRKKWCLMYR